MITEFEKIKEILEKPRYTRPDEDISFLKRHLSFLTFIRQTLLRYGEQVINDIFQCMIYTKIPSNTIIFEFDDVSKECYLLIDGDIEVLFPDINNRGLAKKLWRYDKTTVIPSGGLFGEKSLIDNKKRSATIKTRNTDCILGKIIKNDFLRIFKNISKGDHDTEVKFIKSIAAFKEASKHFADQMTYCLEDKYYKRGEYVVKQGDPLDMIYIVRKGTFQVLYNKSNKFYTEIKLNYLSNIYKEERFTSDRQFELKGTINDTDVLKMMLLGEGEFFGDVEMIPPAKDISLFSLQCVSENSVLLVSKREVYILTLEISRLCAEV